MSTIISPLQQARIKRGWKQSDVEAKTGGQITIASLQRWEGRRGVPCERNIAILCALYEMSAEDLGLNHAIMGTEKKVNFAPQEEGPHMSDMMRRELLCNLGSRLNTLINLWPRRNYHYEELQAEINKAIFDHDVLAQSDSTASISRGEALKSIALVPLQLIGGIAIIEGGTQKTDPDLLLKHCAAGITACTYLRRGKDIVFVSDLTSFYISLLQPTLSSHSEVHRNAAAILLSQSFMLKSFLGSEDDQTFIERAIYYSDLSEDKATQSLAYRRRAYEHWDTKNYKEALRDAEKGYGLAKSSNAIHPIIHSDVASTLSLCQAACGKANDAKANMARARDLFDPTMLVPSMSYSESILAADSGAAYQHMGLWGEATTLYKKSLTAPDISALGYAHQRINYIKMEVSRDDKPRDMDLCVKLLTESVRRAEELSNTTYIHKAHGIYDILRLVWPREPAIKRLGKEYFGGTK